MSERKFEFWRCTDVLQTQTALVALNNHGVPVVDKGQNHNNDPRLVVPGGPRIGLSGIYDFIATYPKWVLEHPNWLDSD